MGKIKLFLVLLIVILPFSLLARDKFMLNMKPPIPGTNPAEINPGCNKCGWEITATSTADTAARPVKAMYMNGKYRLEIKSEDGTQTQVIIFDNAELYILNPFFKTAAFYYLSDRDNTMFLENIFPGVGLQKKDRTVIGREKLDGRECDVISYRILKRGKNMFVWGSVTEWLDKKTGRTLKVESVSDEASLPFNGKNIISAPVRQRYMAGKIKRHFFMDKALFMVPKGYKIVDMKKQYDDALEKQKGIKPQTGYEVRKIVIPPASGRK